MLAPQTKPLLIFGSRHGSIYNLTPSNIPSSIQAIQLSFGDFYDNRQVLKNLPQGMSFKKFLGYKQEMITYLCPYDFYKQQPITGCQNSKQVKIKCINGYQAITAQQYNQVAQIIHPQMLVSLTQYPFLAKDHKKQSNKSYKRAINKTTTYLQQTKLKTKTPSNYLRLAAIHGGKNMALLARSLEHVLIHQVDGIVLCDVCEEQTLEERQAIYNFISQRLKLQNKQMVMTLAGYGKIPDIQHARKFGYTRFQVNYPFFLAAKQFALIKQGDQYVQKQPFKHQNLEPLDKNCKCQTCTRHSESYIAHLIECHQMTAAVLLTIHNIHVYTEYLSQFD